MSMMLVGSPELDRQVQNDPSLLPRVDVRVRIQPLDMPSAAAYLMHRLKVARGRPELIPPATLEVLYKFGRGRPRLLNTLADNALFEAYLAGRHAIDPSDVERAAADLGVHREAPESSESRPLPPSPRSAPRSEPKAAAAPALDLLDGLDLDGAGAPGAWDAHAVDEIDLDLLAPAPAPAQGAKSPAAAFAPASMRSEPMPSRAHGRASSPSTYVALPSASVADDMPELDGLFVELIDE
jgi:hypothetical protein